MLAAPSSMPAERKKSVLLSASVKRFGVSRMQNFLLLNYLICWFDALFWKPFLTWKTTKCVRIVAPIPTAQFVGADPFGYKSGGSLQVGVGESLDMGSSDFILSFFPTSVGHRRSEWPAADCSQETGR